MNQQEFDTCIKAIKESTPPGERTSTSAMMARLLIVLSAAQILDQKDLHFLINGTIPEDEECTDGNSETGKKPNGGLDS